VHRALGSAHRYQHVHRTVSSANRYQHVHRTVSSAHRYQHVHRTVSSAHRYQHVHRTVSSAHRYQHVHRTVSSANRYQHITLNVTFTPDSLTKCVITNPQQIADMQKRKGKTVGTAVRAVWRTSEHTAGRCTPDRQNTQRCTVH